jgi:hypothetical protein
MMFIEILFHTSSTPKRIEDVDAIYTKGGLLCIQLTNAQVQAYPLINIFSICYEHQPHLGSTRKKKS